MPEDPTRVGSRTLSPFGLTSLVPTARLIPGERLVVKPPSWRLPVTGYHLTGRFGQSSGLWASTHTGLDFAAPAGTMLWYCHQSRFGVNRGQRLLPGDLVGYVASTGNTTGPHLHLEVHPDGGDRAVDPEAWLRQHHLHP